MTPLGLIDPSSVLRIDRDAVRVIVRGPVNLDFYDLVRDAVGKSRTLNRPLQLFFDGGEGLDVESLDAALSYHRLILSRGETVPVVIRVIQGSFVISLFAGLKTPHVLEIQPSFAN